MICNNIFLTAMCIGIINNCQLKKQEELSGKQIEGVNQGKIWRMRLQVRLGVRQRVMENKMFIKRSVSEIGERSHDLVRNRLHLSSSR
jgi:hypothetical protein